MKQKDKNAYAYKVLRSCKTPLQLEACYEWMNKLLIGEGSTIERVYERYFAYKEQLPYIERLNA